MALRDDWKSTGKELGSSFKGLGKTLIRSVRRGVEKATDWAESTDEQPSSADAAEETSAAENAAEELAAEDASDAK